MQAMRPGVVFAYMGAGLCRIIAEWTRVAVKSAGAIDQFVHRCITGKVFAEFEDAGIGVWSFGAGPSSRNGDCTGDGFHQAGGNPVVRFAENREPDVDGALGE